MAISEAKSRELIQKLEEIASKKTTDEMMDDGEWDIADSNDPRTDFEDDGRVELARELLEFLK